MKKTKGKANYESQRVREKPWPIVTSDVCEKCPIRCPAGVAYMTKMNTAGKIGRGVACRKEWFLKRKAQGQEMFKDSLKLYIWPNEVGNTSSTLKQ